MFESSRASNSIDTKIVRGRAHNLSWEKHFEGIVVCSPGDLLNFDPSRSRNHFANLSDMAWFCSTFHARIR